MKIRVASFAGSWYPKDAEECKDQINAFWENKTLKLQKPVAGIVPHAGWYFSGRIACNVIAGLKDLNPDVIIIFGMHLPPKSPPYIMKTGAWETPLGPLPIAAGLAEKLTQAYNFKVETPERHARDNTIELQLPFIKYFFKDTSILPIGVPPSKISSDIARQAVQIAGDMGLQVLVIGSTDLTHYGRDYGFFPKGSGAEARKWVREKNDRSFIKTLITMDPEKIIKEGLLNQNACCPGAVAAAVSAAKVLGAESVFKTAYTTSYEQNPGDSFVGYTGAICH